ncbi:class I SAM-dependent methyltransferase [Gammaproteobacteria bacterium]|nr:class I SAM-dependent methyltransferase [Gammaproteobacteria bacterium]
MRDYNKEHKDNGGRKYAYGFDFDIMHKYMIDSILPFKNDGGVLELGSYKGAFTKRLIPHFDSVLGVEASDAAIQEAKRVVGGVAEFVHDRFETLRLEKKFPNIVMTHVLEHLDDPVAILKRVNNEWLEPGGRFFLVCPNANAPSRQIAVKMGLIPHNRAVTDAEAKHGHRCTYTLDVLESEARAAGLNVIHRSGIFFKALANFQWDQLLETDIISDAYLDGCFMLGQIYPDLCSSIFIVCERRD